MGKQLTLYLQNGHMLLFNDAMQLGDKEYMYTAADGVISTFQLKDIDGLVGMSLGGYSKEEIDVLCIMAEGYKAAKKAELTILADELKDLDEKVPAALEEILNSLQDFINKNGGE